MSIERKVSSAGAALGKKSWKKKTPLERKLHMEMMRSHRRTYAGVFTETERLEWVKKQKAKRPFLKKTLGGSFTKEEFAVVKQKQENKCALCDREESKKMQLHADHKISLNRWSIFWNGRTAPYKCSDIRNIQGLCRLCNNKKRTDIY